MRLGQSMGKQRRKFGSEQRTRGMPLRTIRVEESYNSPGDQRASLRNEGPTTRRVVVRMDRYG
jgi:hypothetical protein